MEVLKRVFILISVAIPLIGNGQSDIEFGVTAGINMGFVSVSDKERNGFENQPIPTLHLGINTIFEHEKYLFEGGLSVEGVAFKSQMALIDTQGLPNGVIEFYEIGSYVALPLITYFSKIPLGFHLGLKPKIKVISRMYILDNQLLVTGGKKFHRINYLAPFVLDAIAGISLFFEPVRISLRYEPGLLNRLDSDSDIKEFDHQFKLVVNILFPK